MTETNAMIPLRALLVEDCESDAEFLLRALRQAEGKLREQAELIDKANDAIYVRHLDGKIRFWNRGAERLYGWTRAEAVGHTIADLNLAEMTAAAELEASLPWEGAWTGELKQATKHELEVTVFSRLTVVRDQHGQPESVFAINSDITEKKLLEEKFLHAQRLESLGMLAAGIAHDFNNVLAPVMFAAPMLRKHLTAPHDLKLVETITQSAERGAALVKQILGFVSTSAGERQLTQVKHLLRDVAGIVEGTFPKAIELDAHLAGNLWLVRGNPTQIHQVLLNLCVNARDAMPQGGRLRLSAANRRLDATEVAAFAGADPGDWLWLEVGDTGTGIPPALLEKMWAPFFTTKPAGQGTGLGLATVRSIVRAHRGFIDVRTALGEGTTFRIILPAIPDKAVATPAGAQAAGSVRGDELILVVDDDTAIREIAVIILQAHGYRAAGRADGVDALAWFNTHGQEVSLVVSDDDMPRLGGIALAGALRQIRPCLPILGMSGMSGGKNGHAGIPDLESVANGFLRKPFGPDELLGAVARLLHPAGQREPAREAGCDATNRGMGL